MALIVTAFAALAAVAMFVVYTAGKELDAWTRIGGIVVLVGLIFVALATGQLFIDLILLNLDGLASEQGLLSRIRELGCTVASDDSTLASAGASTALVETHNTRLLVGSVIMLGMSFLGGHEYVLKLREKVAKSG